jgi:hypothetical protein
MEKELNINEKNELLIFKNYSFVEFSASPDLMEKYVI